MDRKKVFLLSAAHDLEMKPPEGFYDVNKGINVKVDRGQIMPVVCLEMAPPTESKTMAAPGDDDPDPDDERCY